MMGVDSQPEDIHVGVGIHPAAEDMLQTAGSRPEGEGVRRVEDTLPVSIQVKEEGADEDIQQVGIPPKEEEDEDIHAAKGDESRRGLPGGDEWQQIRQDLKAAPFHSSPACSSPFFLQLRRLLHTQNCNNAYLVSQYS